MRPTRNGGFGSLHAHAELAELAALDLRPHRRKQVVLLLADVLADQFAKDPDLGLEPLVVDVAILKLGEHPFDYVMFLQRLQNHDGFFGYEFPHGRIELLLFDGSVHGQLGNDRLDELLSLNTRPRGRLLELLEQLFD